MNSPLVIALALALVLMGLGLVTGAAQVLGLRRLAARKLVPSDEATYLRSRHRRRLLTASILFLVGAIIGAAYLSGMETNVDNLKSNAEQAEAAVEPMIPEMTEEQKGLVRLWSVTWAIVISLVFVLVGLAFADAVATRRYWLGIYRELRDEHQAKLRRDLAVYRTQKEQNRPGALGRSEGVSD